MMKVSSGGRGPSLVIRNKEKLTTRGMARAHMVGAASWPQTKKSVGMGPRVAQQENIILPAELYWRKTVILACEVSNLLPLIQPCIRE